MRTFSLTALTRLIGGLALVACLVAVGLAKLEPTPARYRLAGHPHFDMLTGFLLDPNLGTPRVLDPNTGAIGEFRVPEGERIEFGACSPWENEEGESQVVGRWLRQADDEFRQPEQFGLVRLALPSGRVLDQIPLDVLPAGHPCWSPGSLARVVFAGTDCRLYSIDFDRGRDPEVRTIAWHGPEPGTMLTIRDPVWPRDPRFGGRLIATVSYRGRASDVQLTPGRLWWIQLNNDATAVIDAGPLTEPGAAQPPQGTIEERLPNVATAPDGRLTLAYLHQQGHNGLWELWTTRLDVDPATGLPTIRPKETRVLTREHLSELPPFSPDGRHIYGILDDPLHRGRPRVEKFAAFPPAETAAKPAGDQPRG